MATAMLLQQILIDIATSDAKYFKRYAKNHAREFCGAATPTFHCALATDHTGEWRLVSKVEHSPVTTESGIRFYDEPDLYAPNTVFYVGPHRVIVHLDVDAFYAQVEEVRDPSLAGRPLAVTQKYLVVTCNYAARAQGVGKLMATTEARRRCPALVTRCGEDLTPYRAASKAIRGVLARFGTVEKLGLDEAFVDVTQTVEARLVTDVGNGCAAPNPLGKGHRMWSSHDGQVQQTTKMSNQGVGRGGGSSSNGGSEAGEPGQGINGFGAVTDDGAEMGGTSSRREHGRAHIGSHGGTGGSGGGGGSSGTMHDVCGHVWGGGGVDLRLRIGCHLADEMRAAVFRETGYRCSAGIAHNRLLAKLACALHKPNDQTCIPRCEAREFVGRLPVSKIPGIGHRACESLADMGVTSVEQLREVPFPQLVQRFGPRLARFMCEAAQGEDSTPVVDKGPPKSVSVEDSLKCCRSLGHCEAILRNLSGDLLCRLREEACESGRWPRTLTLGVRHRHAAQARHPRPPAFPFRRDQMRYHDICTCRQLSSATASNEHAPCGSRVRFTLRCARGAPNYARTCSRGRPSRWPRVNFTFKR
eukprot:jgi/Mesvir1/7845/Mv11779-RA.1